MTHSSFYFVRHGHTDPFCNRCYCGGEWDVPLNDDGKKQAEFLARNFKSIFSSAPQFYVSPMKRTMQTANLLLKGSSNKFSLEENLREWKLGEWDTLSWEDLPSIFDRSVAPPSKETREFFEKRVSQFLQEKICHSSRSVVVSHGLVWNSISFLLGIKKTEINPCGLVHVEEDDDRFWTARVLHEGFPL